MTSCFDCGGAILEPNKIYGYSGKICYCGTKAQNQIRAAQKWQQGTSMDVPPLAQAILKILERIEDKLV